jgi:molybdate transport system ATP-binding protein
VGLALSDTQCTTTDPALNVRVRKQIAQSEPSIFELDLNFEAPAGITILFGASGAGKTTLLDCIAGLQVPDEGTVRVGDKPLFDSLMHVDVPPHRRQIGYLFQTLVLFPHMTVGQNVQYGLAQLDKTERTSRSSEILESFHIAGLTRRRPHQISGGERQRVALARALVTGPRVLLLDEPLTALDAVTKALIIDDLRAWNQRYRIPILYVTHDREEVFALGDRVMALEAGRIVAQGAPQEVLRRPQLESIAQLAGFENIFECTIVDQHPEQGTMTCRIAGTSVNLEVPLTRVDTSKTVRVGIRAGDILIASSLPQGLSARNVLGGVLRRLERRDVTIVATVACSVEFGVHLTPGAVKSLQLTEGSQVWLVLKTYSCHVLQTSLPQP